MCTKPPATPKINPKLQWPPGRVLNSSDPQDVYLTPATPKDDSETPAILKDVS